MFASIRQRPRWPIVAYVVFFAFTLFGLLLAIFGGFSPPSVYSQQMSSAASHWTVYWLGVVVPGALVAVALWKALRYHLQERAARLPVALVPGPITLRGVATPDAAGANLATATIHQQWPMKIGGDIFKSCWGETGREANAPPFSLLHPSGERIRVEPNRQIIIKTPLSETIEDAPDRRRKLASIGAGQEVTITGYLTRISEAGGPFRDATGWRLIPPPDQSPMTLVAASVNDNQRRKRFLLLWALFLLVGTVCGNYLFFSGYREQLQKGEVVWANTKSVRDVPTYHPEVNTPPNQYGSGGGTRPAYTSHQYQVTTQHPTDKQIIFSTEVSPDIFYEIQEKTIKKLPFIVTPSSYWLGEELEGLDPRMAAGFLALLLMLATLYPLTTFWYAPWYEKASLREA